MNNFVTYKNLPPLSHEWKMAVSEALDALWAAYTTFDYFSPNQAESYLCVLGFESGGRVSDEDFENISEWYQTLNGSEQLDIADSVWLMAVEVLESELAKMFSQPQPLQEEGIQTVTAADVMDHVKGWKCCTAKGNTDELKQAVDAYNDNNGFKSASPINLNIQDLIGTLVVVVSEKHVPDEIAEQIRIALGKAINIVKASS